MATEIRSLETMFKQVDKRKVAGVQVEAYWPRRHLLPLPAGLMDGNVKARINHGRWIADCPFCPGAEMVAPSDPRFFCMSCDNNGSGKWIKVVFPKQADEIEAILSKRAQVHERNWEPHESVDDLKAEDRAMRKGVRL